MRKFLAAAAAVALGLTAGMAQAADKTKVGFVYVGPVGDMGWSYQHDQGRQAIVEAFGDKVETTYVESVSEGPDAERVIEKLARSGNDIIFTTSFGYMNPTLKVAKKYPNVKFEHATGYKRSDNVSTYAARFYEGRYVIGQIAAKMSKSNIVGYIGSVPIPEVVRGINAFLLGAQSVNPDMKIKVIWVNSWFDPGKEADAAKALIDQGADIITQHTDSAAPLQLAAERGVLGFGQASDMIKFAPNNQLTAIVDVWDDYYVSRVKAVMDGTWKSQDTWGGFDAKMVKMADYTNLPEDVVAMAKETAAAIEAGTLKPFTGPIFKQDGTEAVKEGETLDDGALLGMNWYVKGVDGKLPKN
ncbi:BMP family ABC transporter substrate-binding protein [Cohaesibacter celericrescens]|uniref:BMP family ABC transporter substrate-binding protein n=1 Tax=Cohaesibacter celericrescens TaxID=2067669 RepID=A0A2N5XSZ0_9HYPH|nr:BMP family ABC transporter substrate-binding protein [Cohaesibacter celericrescens]PLW77623.1 BMP family ABC transporter substrate-binding protein [Cohaesibacter celericrescens]